MRAIPGAAVIPPQQRAARRACLPALEEGVPATPSRNNGSPPWRPSFQPCNSGWPWGQTYLNRRIDARVDAMVAPGLVDEVRGLLAAGFHDNVAPRPSGYKGDRQALDGSITLEEVVQAIKTATRHRYGKSQRT